MIVRIKQKKTFLRQFGGNVALFFPLGFLLPVLSRRYSKFGKALTIGMICSAGIEIMQLILDILLGYKYRICDVDDFILNICGFIVGYIALKVIDGIFTDSRKEHQAQEAGSSFGN